MIRKFLLFLAMTVVASQPSIASTSHARHESKAFSFVKKGDLGQLRKYIQQYKTPNMTDAHHRTLLMWAAAGGYVDVCKFLIHAGARWDLRDDRGNTALLLSVSIDPSYEAEFPLPYYQGGEDPKYRGDSRGVMYLLVEAGANPNIKNAVGDTILKCVIGHGIEFADTRDFDDIRLLIEHGADVRTPNPSGKTILNQVLMRGIAYPSSSSLDFITLILSKKPTIEDKINCLFVVMDTPEYQTIAEEMIKSGMDVNVRFDDGETPLMLAARLRLDDLLPLLIEAKGDVDAIDQDGITALMYACDKHDVKAVKTLLVRHANVNLAAQGVKEPLTALKIAQRGQLKNDNDKQAQTEIIEALKLAGAKE